MKQGMEQGEGRLSSLDGLVRERLPQRDLWAGIEARISPPQVAASRRSWLGVYALAASISVAMLAGVLLREHSPVDPRASGMPLATEVAASESAAASSTFDNHPYSNRDGQPSATPTLSPRTLRMLRSESLDNAPALVAERAEASGLLKATYSTGSGHNPHSQQAILRANLKLVSQAEREVRRALRIDPESASLQGLLKVAEEKRAALTNLLVHEPD